MQQANQMSLLRQVRVVLLSYLTRPGLLWAVLGLLAGLACFGSAYGISHAQGRSSPYGQTLTSLVAVVGAVGLGCAAMAMVFVILLHAREQFLGLGARTFPQTRKANLIVGGALIVVISLLLAEFVTPNYRHTFAIFVVWFGILILASYAAMRLWLLPLVAIVGFVSFESTTLSWKLDRLVGGDHRYSYIDGDSTWAIDPLQSKIDAIRQRISKEDGEFLAAQRRQIMYSEWESWQEREETLQVQRVAVFFAEILAFVGLAAVARPSRRSANMLVGLIRRFNTDAPPVAVVREQSHTFIKSRFSRSLHRRFAAHDWRAAGVAAIGMTALSLWFLLAFRNGIAAPMLGLMLALLPGALVAIAWRERWPTFEFESLYPVSRHELVTDMATGLMLDIAEFWIASVIPAAAACACLRVEALHDPRFWAAILAGGMMQFMWLAGIFLVGQRRQTVSYIAGLAPVVIAIFLSFDALWRQSSPLHPKAMLLVAAIEMLSGLAIFLITWAWLLRTPRPNAAHVRGPAALAG